MLTRFRNLNLRFIEAGEGGEGAGGGEQQTQVVDQGQQQTAPEQGNQGQQPQGNPAWEPLRSALDPISFSKIEPHLKEWDAGVQRRIEQANSQFAPYQPLVKDRQPEFIQKALAYADQLEQDPARVYQMLGQFLQQTGRMPTAKEAEEQLDKQDGQEDPQGAQQPDPMVQQLARQQQQVLAYIQQQQQAEAIRQADQALETAIGSLKQAHPELTQEDTQEIIRRAAFAAQQNPGQDIDFAKALEGAYSEFAGLKNRILSTPRPGDSAPQLPPISGGTPTAPSQQQKSWGQYSSEDIQNFIAGQLAQNK